MIFRRTAFLLTAVIGIVWISDFLFYHQPVGWSLSIFLAAASVFLICKGGAYLRTRTAMMSMLVLASLLIAFAVQPGPLVLLMSLGALSALALLIRQGAPRDPAQLIFGLFKFGCASWFRAILDLRLFGRYFQRKSFTAFAKKFAKGIHSWILPVGGSLVFSSLFSLANPVISRELHLWSETFRNILLSWQLDPFRWFFWFATAAGAWALLRVRIRMNRAASTPAPAPSMSLSRSFFLRRCLLLFNLVFAVQTALDLLYLFGGFHLPEGMTYAEYAHRGSYPLVFTALLAAAFVLVAYSSGAATRETRVVRILVLVWLAQNVFLTFTAAWRLHVYTDVYSLTRLRVAAGIWMFLVASGLAWIGLRIAGGSTNRWLINRVFITTFVVLFLSCFINFDGQIAWHNARHSREGGGSGFHLDYEYMRELGPEAIPALVWLRDKGKYHPKKDVLNELRCQVNAQMSNWRGWTYRSWMLWDGGLS